MRRIREHISKTAGGFEDGVGGKGRSRSLLRLLVTGFSRRDGVNGYAYQYLEGPASVPNQVTQRMERWAEDWMLNSPRGAVGRAVNLSLRLWGKRTIHKNKLRDGQVSRRPTMGHMIRKNKLMVWLLVSDSNGRPKMGHGTGMR